MRIKTLSLLFVLVSLASAQDHPAQNNAILHVGLSDPAQLATVEVTKGETRKGFDHWNLTITLTAPAPEGGAEISLAADPVTAAAVPPTMTVPESNTTATIVVGANPLATEGSIYANYVVTKSGVIPIPAPVDYGTIITKVVANERNFVSTMKNVHPLIETYIQNLHENKTHEVGPVGDVYFLERMSLTDNGYVNATVFDKKETKHGFKSMLSPHLPSFLNAFAERQYIPAGFAQMVILDPDMKAENYTFTFVRREFLGEIRTLVFDVHPKDGKRGLFVGRIWVEDRDDNIVRFNGTYSSTNSRTGIYLHFDSWRANLQPRLWLPTYVYSEETGGNKNELPPFHDYFFKAQTRLWGYDSDPTKHQTELTEVKVEDGAVDDSKTVRDYSPLESERMWQRTAEDNTLDHLQKIGLLAPAGDVDKVLTTVVNNIIATNQLDIPEVRCRILLTTPIESFTIGNTIVVSRGLLDVLPDEASLAAMLAHELAHIALGHRIDEKLAFNDNFFFADENTFRKVSFSRNPLDEAAADAKAQELLAKSPYKDKLGDAGLFLKALQTRATLLPNLIHPHFGNPLETKKSVGKMGTLMAGAPQLEVNNITQTAALPLGSRVKLDSWGNNLSLMNFKAVPKLSAQDKMPFEVTPLYVYLTRVE